MKTPQSARVTRSILSAFEKFAPGAGWDEQLHPRAQGGRFGDKPDAAKPAAGDKPARAPAEQRPSVPASGGPAIAREPVTAPPEGTEVHAPDPYEENTLGMTSASRVGVPGGEVPPPPRVPRLPNLTQDERDVEGRFASLYESDPDKAAGEYLSRLKKGEIGDGPNVFSTDDVKLLSPDYNPQGKSDDDTKDARSRYNVAVHQTANAMAKKAFLTYLDDTVSKLPKDRQTVLVTAGGVAAGKGFALSSVSETSEISKKVGAVWDSAGEQNGTEKPWILDECKKRGIKPTFVFVHADPKETWENPKRGVIERAQKKGRMVDARLFADSYAVGAKNFHSFMEKNKDKADFIVLDNSGATPKRIDRVPPEALKYDSDEIHRGAMAAVDKKTDLRPAVRRGATIGTRIWEK